jgi:chemotaxis protein MotB
MARKKRPEDVDNHDRWLVSYADFITLLFAFFVVMYGISQVSEGKYKVLSQSMVKAFVRADQQQAALAPSKNEKPAGDSGVFEGNAGKPVAWQANPQIVAKMQGIRDNLKQVLEPLEKSGQVRVNQTARGIELEFNAAALFNSGEAALQGEARKQLALVAQVLSTTDNAVQVEGHTDNIPISTPAFPSNWELSGARAGSVVRMFIDRGVRPERLMAVGYADTRPLEGNDTPDGRSRNRRVTVMVLPTDRDPVDRGW